MRAAHGQFVVPRNMLDPSSQPSQKPHAGDNGGGQSSGACITDDWIPRDDTEFNGLRANFVNYANADPVVIGLVPKLREEQ